MITLSMAKRISLYRTIQLIISISILGVLVALIFSSIKAGYYYMFDVDEFHHSQIVYLLASGQKAFSDFLMLPNSPILHWILVPFYRLTGFTFDALYAGRTVMIIFFLSRIFLVFTAMYQLSNFRGAVITISLLLLDTVTLFSAMQIRPDNVMIVLFLIGLNCLLLGGKHKAFLFTSGIFFALSALTLIKIGPSVVLVGLAVSFWYIRRRQLHDFLYFCSGGCAAVLIFLGYFTLDGRVNEVINQLIIYPPKIYTSFQYPTPLGFFYTSGNIHLFGVYGKPPSWEFLWLLLLLMGGGIAITLQSVIKDQKITFRHAILLSCIASFFSQFYFLLKVPSAFVQYYMPVHFFGHLLAGYAIALVLNSIRSQRLSIITSGLLVIMAGYFGYSMYQGNIGRSTILATDQRTHYERIWAVVPADEAIHPRVLFRPLATNVVWEHFLGDYSPFFLTLIPNLSTFFQTHEVNYIYKDPYLLSFYPPSFQNFIATHYSPIAENPTILKRQEE